jgi:uroporphyrinogen-III synthase
VYRRECAQPTAAESTALEARFAARQIQVVTATSVELGANLLTIGGPTLRGELESARWLVPGERVAASLRDAGCRGPWVIARSAQDQDLVSALLRWRAVESGA